MALNVYLMPAVAGPKPGQIYGKYWPDLAAAGVAAAQMPYGAEPTFLVAAQDVPAGLHQTVAGDAACTAVPDLAQTVGGQLAAVQNQLEALNIPTQWATAGMSYGSVVRVVAIVFQLAQRLQGLGRNRLFGGAVTLDTRFNQLPQSVRTDLQDMAASFNFDTGSLSGTSTVRAILKALADQWPNLSVPFGPLTL
jgi:hypothetical protein